MDAIKVFVIYSPDSKAHVRRVERLAAALRRDGLDSAIDQPEMESPTAGWGLWAAKTVDWADFVLAVCTERFLRRVGNAPPPGRGLGAVREGLLVHEELFDNAGKARVIPVVFDPADEQFVPDPLRGIDCCALDDQKGYDRLLAMLTGRTLDEVPSGSQIGRGRRPEVALDGELGAGQPSPAELQVNQWIKDGEGVVSKLDEPLRAGRNYVYCFEIATERRSGANAERFEEPRGLDRPGAVVELQVRSPLLRAEEGFARRRVDYQPGRGLKIQEFALYSQAVIVDPKSGKLSGWTGRHRLDVLLLLDGRSVYSHSWTITVEPLLFASVDSSLPLLEAPAEPEASLPADYQVAGMPALRASAGWADQVTLEVRGRPPIRGADLDREKLIQFGARARKILNEFSRRHTPHQNGKMPWKIVWADLLYHMIDWGRQSVEGVLGPRGLHPVLHQTLESLPFGSRLHVDSDMGGFPWEWLYAGPYYPSKNPPPLGSAECVEALKGFWGLRFQLEVMPFGDYQRTEVRALLSRNGDARVLAALNSTADGTAAPLQAEFLQKMETWPSVRRVICQDSEQVIEALKRSLASASDGWHLLYVYAHHSSGASLNTLGYYDFGDSTLFLKGKNQDPLTRQDVEYGVFGGLKFLPEAAPLVLLNACGSAAGGDYFPCALLPFFIIKANAPAALGTIAEINTMAAHQFGSEFLAKWLEGTSACRALAEVRRQWLFGKGNPYALYYTILGDADVCLV